jgi:acetyl/propionyl-CoA carboxylase alpha subunit
MKKVLIANRGEIVARIARTCRRLAISSVSIYSDADSTQAFIGACDESINIGGSRADDSYLNIDAILKAAKDCSADAIHPGYGFLSENAEFAARVRAAGMIFIGPSEDVLRDGGEKDKARALATKLNIPCVPGVDGRGIKVEELLEQAKKIGVPLLVKAAGGGGGRGMRRVDSLSDLPAALAAAEREATAFFGNPHLLLEKLVSPARHIEVQILGDSHGNVLHFFERDCSIQRKFQKVIEESPARDIPASVRTALHQAALSIGRELKICGAATVEFLYSPNDNAFYFLEINPRLQVEHGVTEEVCKVDLVELQIIVARGEPLPYSQEDISLEGHAIEARVYAEIPQKDFIPSLGEITSFSLPVISGARFDHALDTGSTVSPHYDSMLVKTIGIGESFDAALAHLLEGLSGISLRGVDTNIAFLLDLLESPLVPPPSTSLLDGFIIEDLRHEHATASIAILYLLMEIELNKSRQAEDPFYTNYFFRHTHSYNDNAAKLGAHQLLIKSGTFSSNKGCEALLSRAHSNGSHNIEGSCHFDSSCLDFSVKYSSKKSYAKVVIENEEYEFHSICHHLDKYGQLSLQTRYRGHQLTIEQEPPIKADIDQNQTSANKLLAPLPGTIAKVSVNAGGVCATGETLIILESMKTEHLLCAPRDVAIETIHVKVGDTVQQGSVLVDYKAE